MRVRQVKRFLCGILAAAAVLLLLLMVWESNVKPGASRVGSVERKAFKAPSGSPFPSPSSPPSLLTPPYPLPDGLKPLQFLHGGEGEQQRQQQHLQQHLQQQLQQQQHLQQQQLQQQRVVERQTQQLAISRARGQATRSEARDKESLALGDDLWNLIVTPKKSVKDRNGQNSLLGCDSKHHVFFAKVHKTGSSTVANIMQRYGFTRDLNFVLPRKRIHSQSYNYISMPGQTVTSSKLIPHPIGQNYDMLWNHAIYNSDFYHSIMPEDTVFVTILRRPLDQFQSAFEYYGHIPGTYLYNILQMNVSNPLTVYLHNPQKYERVGAFTTYIRNKQSQDLGMLNVHVVNATLRQQYIHKLDNDFHLVMIMEFFDESLVMLRRLLCWSIKDILYIPKNKNIYKKKRTFSEYDLSLHKTLNVADFDLYNHFLARFQRTLLQQDANFHHEVVYLKNLLVKIQWFCGHVSRTTPPLTVPASRWNLPFLVALEDCVMMQKHELPFLNDIMVDAIRKYQRSFVQRLYNQTLIH